MIGELLDAGLMHADVLTVAGAASAATATSRTSTTRGELRWRAAPARVARRRPSLRPATDAVRARRRHPRARRAPRPRVIKVSSVAPERRVVEAPARVFDDQARLPGGLRGAASSTRDHVGVVRQQGPRPTACRSCTSSPRRSACCRTAATAWRWSPTAACSGASGKVPAAIHVHARGRRRRPARRGCATATSCAWTPRPAGSTCRRRWRAARAARPDRPSHATPRHRPRAVRRLPRPRRPPRRGRLGVRRAPTRRRCTHGADRRRDRCARPGHPGRRDRRRRRRRAAGRGAGARRAAGDRGDAAHAAALAAIERIAAEVEGAVVGAGTVTTTAQIADALAAGARFLVSPGRDAACSTALQASGLPFLPGTATASDMVALVERGITRAKFFPAEVVGGVGALKAFAGPFPQLRFCPTGGITRPTRRLPRAAERGLRRRLVADPGRRGRRRGTGTASPQLARAAVRRCGRPERHGHGTAHGLVRSRAARPLWTAAVHPWAAVATWISPAGRPVRMRRHTRPMSDG